MNSFCDTKRRVSHSRLSYPKPGPTGGRLIRAVISFLREKEERLPFSSHILIATSGGADSMALAHLLVRYGRRVVSREKITLLHINHGWRGAASDGDARFVRAQAHLWGVACKVVRLRKSDRARKGESPEERARRARQRIYAKYAKIHGKTHGAIVLTAHHADDLAETVLWRLATGAAHTHGGGIAFKHEIEVRPLLRIRKKTLIQYLKEEGQTWREDSTNHEGMLLRSRMRRSVMPELEALFPRAIEHLVDLALRAQNQIDSNTPLIRSALGALGIRIRRSHYEGAEKWMKDGTRGCGEIHLADGWRLRREGVHRLVLEKVPLEGT